MLALELQSRVRELMLFACVGVQENIVADEEADVAPRLGHAAIARDALLARRHVEETHAYRPCAFGAHRARRHVALRVMNDDHLELLADRLHGEVLEAVDKDIRAPVRRNDDAEGGMVLIHGLMVAGTEGFPYPSPVRTFFLDLASSAGTIACCDDAVRAALPADRRIADHELQPLVAQALAQATWTWDDVERVACVIGPGGFMSLRVAVSFCNALAWLRAIPIAGIHLSDLYAQRAAQSFIWLHSTKKQEVFVRSFNSPLWPEPTHLSLDAALAALPSGAAIAGELIPEHHEAFQAAGAQLLPLLPLADVLPEFLSKLTYTDQKLAPWYGREG